MLNVAAGETRASSAVIPVGGDGAIHLASNTAADLIVDINGAWYPADGPVHAGRLVTISPRRVMDTRLAAPGRVSAGSSRLITTADLGIPLDARAVSATITVTDSVGPGFITAFPGGTARPPTSVANTDAAGQTRAVGVIVGVGPTGAGLELFTSSAVHIVVDVTGYVTGPAATKSTAGLVRPQAPVRLVDTRLAGRGRLLAGSSTSSTADDGAADIGGYIGTVTLIDAVTDGYATAIPDGIARPLASTVNVSPGHTVAAMAVTPATATGVRIFTSATSNIAYDVTAAILGTPLASEPGTVSPPETWTHLETRIIGRSVLGQPITALRRGTPGGAVVLVFGPIHGNEAAGMQIVDDLDQLHIPPGIDLWQVPSMNQDGVAANSRCNANGVDVKRNFP